MRLKVFTSKGAVAAIFLPSHTSENIGKNNDNLSISICSAVLSNKYKYIYIYIRIYSIIPAAGLLFQPH